MSGLIKLVLLFSGHTFPTQNSSKSSNVTCLKNTLPYQVSISLFQSQMISNICTKITYSLGLLVQINKWNLFNTLAAGLIQAVRKKQLIRT